MPEISEVSKNIMIEETKDGLNVEIVDQDGRSMFPGRLEGALRAHAKSFDEARRPLKQMPFAGQRHGAHLRLACSVATGARGRGSFPRHRAGAVRLILEAEGVQPAHVLHGRRQSGYPAAVSGRSVPRRQSAGDNHVDAGRTADSDGFPALVLARSSQHIRLAVTN